MNPSKLLRRLRRADLTDEQRRRRLRKMISARPHTNWKRHLERAQDEEMREGETRTLRRLAERERADAIVTDQEFEEGRLGR